MKKLKILFVCTGNSCRSQMAEGWCRKLKGDIIEPYSAGVDIHAVDSNAIEVMQESGVDISGHHPKHINELKDIVFDHVVTVCDITSESCTIFPIETKVVHINFQDPPKLAKSAMTKEEALTLYRRIRDEIKSFIESLPDFLKQN